MTENGKEGKVEKVELLGIALEIFPKWTGKRTSRDVKIGDGEHKFSVGLPVPSNDEEAKRLYDTTLADIIERGVKQLSYGKDTEVTKKIKADLKAGVNFGKLKDTSPYGNLFETDLSTTKVRAASEATMLKNKLASAGLTARDLDEETIRKIIEQHKKKKAEK